MRNIVCPALLLAACSSTHAPATPRAPAAPTAAATAAPPPSRFDLLVREDFFDGFKGDTAALDRAMKTCEDVLAREPANAEAMVWHGSGLLARASLAFEAGDATTGMTLWQRGIAEENHAVSLAPDDVGVRIPRGAVFLNMAPYIPDPATKQDLLQTGVADYEHTLALQAPYFAHLTEHARGQLLWGLADGWDKLGSADKARAYYERIARELPESQYSERATAWLAGTPSTEPAPCGECHAASRAR